MHIIFFTSNINCKNGGLEEENIEEINILQCMDGYNLIVLEYNMIRYISYIVSNFDRSIIYIDFCNENINYISFLNYAPSDKIAAVIYKFKGYTLSKFTLSKLCYKFKTKMITTADLISDKMIVERYWAMKPSILFNECLKTSELLYPQFIKLEASKHFTFIFIGRKDSYKRVNEMIEVYKLIPDKYNVRLIVIGKGEIDEKQQSKYNIIEFPYLESKLCLGILEKYCNCLILPSISEGFGRVVVQALEFNKHVIVTENTMMKTLLPDYNFYIKSDLSNLYQLMVNTITTPPSNMKEFVNQITNIEHTFPKTFLSHL